MKTPPFLARSAIRLGACCGALSMIASACGSNAPAEPPAAVAQPSSTTEQSLACPEGTFVNPDEGRCAPVIDRRAEMRALAGDRAVPPDLRLLRGGDGQPRLGERRRGAGMPVPGGVGSGITYDVGHLAVTKTSTLFNHMIVYPNGLGNLPDFLFTTSTNRMEKTLEILAAYKDANTHDLDVFDWSCSTTDPCTTSQGQTLTSPGYVVVAPIGSVACHLGEQQDSAGASHQIVFYANTTDQTGSPWHDKALLWNYCTAAWDLVYDHVFSGTQKNCSLDNSCGWWGPILENFFDLSGPTPIAELGVFNAQLVLDGVTNNMATADTAWNPPASNWNTCFRSPNPTFGVTNQACPSACTPESTAAFCSQLGKNCGQVTGTDNCGFTRSVTSCGTCTSPQTCGGGGTANVCGGGSGSSSGSSSSGSGSSSGGGGTCAPAYSQSNCLTYVQGTQVSSGGHNWLCSNGNCANCASTSSCAPGASGCPWGVVWTDQGACQ